MDGFSSTCQHLFLLFFSPLSPTSGLSFYMDIQSSAIAIQSRDGHFMPVEFAKAHTSMYIHTHTHTYQSEPIMDTRMQTDGDNANMYEFRGTFYILPCTKNACVRDIALVCLLV